MTLTTLRVALFCCTALCCTGFAQTRLDSLSITVTGASREFSYTNTISAFFYGETNAPNATSWEGFNVLGNEALNDYDLYVDGTLLERKDAEATVYPDFLRRTYPGGVMEELRLIDSVAMFSVTVSAPSVRNIEFVPWVTDGRSPRDFVLRDSGSTVLLARARHTMRSTREDYPVWLAVRGNGAVPLHSPRTRRGQFSPFSLQSGPAQHHVFTVAAVDSFNEAKRLFGAYAARANIMHAARRNRMERLLEESRLELDDRRLTKAVAWAKLSLDALMMHQGTFGIFAGLPWFNNYWGRDTFIALPGATLVTGRFREALHILRSFAAFQMRDTVSTAYGRIPNFVTATERAYNTADGTPRFVMMAREYVERSSDSSFVAEIYPVILRATEGAISNHTDSLGFLVHRDAETWMDAAGPDGPWSPRGNRANDIQALWIAQLDAASWFAHRRRDMAHAKIWDELRQRCSVNFRKYFIDAGGNIVDHLNADGSPDHQLRPNQIFTAPLLDDITCARMLRTVTTKLTYEHGVASLSQDDPHFHPYHRCEPFYPKDAAYHNGIVWTWLQGPLISELCRADRARTAFRLTKNAVHQILDRGAVGTQSELIDAAPRPGEHEPRLSGTFSQARNLAEFIRNMYEDYLGIRVELLTHTLFVDPHLPLSIGRASAVVPIRGKPMTIRYDLRPGKKLLTFDARDLRDTLRTQVTLSGDSGKVVRTMLLLTPGSMLSLTMDKGTVKVLRGGTTFPASIWSIDPSPMDSLLGHLTFATPVVHSHLKALRGPSFPLLSHSSVVQNNPAASLIANSYDPADDDTGATGFVYPRSSVFVPGSFDITHVTVRCDSVNAYFALQFRALSDPGWHPEYGFQLTCVAIAIDEDGEAGSGRRDVPANTKYMLPPGRGYERLILVGGGVEIQDQSGEILSAYLPVEEDRTLPFGNAADGTISFAVPLKYLGKPDERWSFTVLSGAQDDHGGAGIGEFREVREEAGEWNGGGRKHPYDSNVYDVLECGATKR